MRHFLVILSLLIAVSTFASPAEARRGGGGGSSEFVDFIAETEIPDRDTGKPLSLCHLVKKWHVLFVPLFYQSEGYALAVNRCDADAYYSVDAEILAGLKAEGILPADLAAEPALTTAEAATPFAWGGLVLLVGAFKFLGKGRASGSSTQASGASDYMSRVLEVACRAALADGEVEDREVGVICGIAGQFTTSPVSPDRMRKMIGYVRVQPEPADYTHLGTGLDEPGRNQLLRVAMMVIGKENMAAGPGKTFVDKLAMGLLIEPARRDALAAAI